MENENRLEDEQTEQAEGIGQVILGELETIGGILTADPIAQAEGDFNVEMGTIHQEAAENLHENDKTTEANEQ